MILSFSRLLIFCVFFVLSGLASGDIRFRQKRDKKSFASNVGGPLAAGSGPELPEQSEGAEAVTPVPTQASTAESLTAPAGCGWTKVAHKVLAIVKYTEVPKSVGGYRTLKRVARQASELTNQPTAPVQAYQTNVHYAGVRPKAQISPVHHSIPEKGTFGPNAPPYLPAVTPLKPAYGQIPWWQKKPENRPEGLPLPVVPVEPEKASPYKGAGLKDRGKPGSDIPLEPVNTNVDYLETQDEPPEKFGFGHFVFLTSLTCASIGDCLSACNESNCNYVLRSASTGYAYLYKIFEPKLAQGPFVDSAGYDSYVMKCPEKEETYRACDAFVIPPAVLEHQFGDWSKKFARNFADDATRDQIKQIFTDNSRTVKILNCLRGSRYEASFELNEFADLSYEQFIVLNGVATPQIGEKFVKPSLAGEGQHRVDECPRFSWEDAGVVPLPRRQLHCGACYAFAVADLISSQYKIDRQMRGAPAGGNSLLLSPQFLVDCMQSPAGLGCTGGRPIQVLRNLSQNCFPGPSCTFPTEQCYPYSAKQGQCSLNKSCLQANQGVKVVSSSISDTAGPDEKNVVAAMLHRGPLVGLVDAGQSWQFFSGSGVMHASQCTNKQNHAILVVGYDYTGPVPFYIIKNSWGTSWGDGGYIRLQAGANTCGIAKGLVSCCTDNCSKFAASQIPVNSRNCA